MNSNDFTMSSLEEDESFTITWRIKNFSMCPEEMDRYIESPVVRVSQFGKSEWALQLYPKGDGNDRGFVSCFLKCKNSGIYETVKIEYALFVIIESSRKKIKRKFNYRITEHDFTYSCSWGFKDWISLKGIRKEKDMYLPKDTLTIKCLMKCKNTEKDTKGEVFDAFSRVGKNSLNDNKCCIETIIPVQTKKFLWPIRSFLSLSENKRITLSMFSFMKENPSFNVTLFKTAESQINIEIKRKDVLSNTMFVRCTISAANAPLSVIYCSEHEFLFNFNSDAWNFSFSPLLKLGKLKDEYFKFNDGVLYLQFNFDFSIKGQMLHSEKQDWGFVFLPTKSQCQLEMFTSSTIDEEQTIVTLRSVGRSFTVHRALLKAKSEVFHAMFENDMKEKDTGVVDIPDVEPETLGRMLSFLYSGTVGDLSTTDVISLYAAAHKYQVQSLMNHCSSLLMSSLIVSNVCDILKFAELYQDERLLKTAEEFIFTYSDPDCILMSQDWKNLMENNLSLAANIMYKMLTK